MSRLACEIRKRKAVEQSKEAVLNPMEPGFVDYRKCLECSGPIAIEGRRMKTKNPEQAESTRKCTECGVEFIAYKKGAMWPGICKECMTKRLRMGTARRNGKSCGETLFVDLKDRPEVLEWLEAEAKAELRTTEAQIVWILMQKAKE